MMRICATLSVSGALVPVVSVYVGFDERVTLAAKTVDLFEQIVVDLDCSSSEQDGSLDRWAW